MSNTFIIIVLTILNYFFGSISSAIIISKYIKKVDIRKIGYKTAGGSNVAHNIGIKWGIVVAIFDVLKGLPILLITKNIGLEGNELIPIALAAFAGHCWPIWFNFSGGRGIGTLLGIIVFLTPKLSIPPVIIFAMTFIPSLLKKLNIINLRIISSPTMTLLAIVVYIYITMATEQLFDTILGVSLLFLVLFRRITARIYEYKTYNPFKLFFSRLLFDNSEVIK